MDRTHLVLATCKPSAEISLLSHDRLQNKRDVWICAHMCMCVHVASFEDSPHLGHLWQVCIKRDYIEI